MGGLLCEVVDVGVHWRKRARVVFANSGVRVRSVKAAVVTYANGVLIRIRVEPAMLPASPVVAFHASGQWRSVTKASCRQFSEPTADNTAYYPRCTVLF